MNMNLSFNLTKYTGVMAFYAVLTYILFPAIAYFLFGKTLEAAGNGFIAGSIVSVILWRMVGMGMVKGAWAGCKILHNYKWRLIIYVLNNPVIVEKNRTVFAISKNSSLSGMWIFIWSPTSIYLCVLCRPFFPILKWISASIKKMINVMNVITINTVRILI